MMLNSLAPEVGELLKDRPIVTGTLNILRWMTPSRQLEVAKLMVFTGNFSRSFAQALLIATSPEERIKWKSKPIRGVSQEQKARMQREADDLLSESVITESYGTDALRLVVASGYVSKLIKNQTIESYLSQNHPEILQKFRAIVAAEPLDGRQSDATKARAS